MLRKDSKLLINKFYNDKYIVTTCSINERLEIYKKKKSDKNLRRDGKKKPPHNHVFVVHNKKSGKWDVYGTVEVFESWMSKWCFWA